MKILDDFRQKRRDIYQDHFFSQDLCMVGLAMMPAFLFNPSTVARIIQFLLFWFLAWLAGKKNNPLITLIVILGIVLFNLLVPYGEVIFQAGPIRITAGALWGGIHRAVTLEGLIMLSRVCIRPDLRLPGTFGSLVSDSFRMFEQINERKGIISRKNIIGGIDQLMIELSAEEDNPPQENMVPVRKRSLPGMFILFLMLALVWVIRFFPVIGRLLGFKP